jgi:diguanylate cyclase (GGDEF)-like protein
MVEIDGKKCITFISEILMIMKSTNQYQKVLSLVIDKVTRMYHCQTCAVVLIDPKTEYLYVENSNGLSLTFCNAFRRKFARGKVAELLWTGKPVIIENGAEMPSIAEELKLEHDIGSAAAVQIAVDQRTLGYLQIDCREQNVFEQEDIKSLQAFADLIGLALNKGALYEENMRLDTIDHETDFLKYSWFCEKVDTAMARAKDFKEDFGLILLDVDNYKEIMHTFGYDAAKKLIKEIAELIKQHLHSVDSGGRFGFDELIILKGKSSVKETLGIAKEISKSIKATTFVNGTVSTTVSIGVSVYPVSGRNAEHLLRAAKEALYQAQREDKSGVRVFKLPPDENLEIV